MGPRCGLGHQIKFWPISILNTHIHFKVTQTLWVQSHEKFDDDPLWASRNFSTKLPWHLKCIYENILSKSIYTYIKCTTLTQQSLIELNFKVHESKGENKPTNMILRFSLHQTQIKPIFFLTKLKDMSN